MHPAQKALGNVWAEFEKGYGQTFQLTYNAFAGEQLFSKTAFCLHNSEHEFAGNMNEKGEITSFWRVRGQAG